MRQLIYRYLEECLAYGRHLAVISLCNYDDESCTGDCIYSKLKKQATSYIDVCVHAHICRVYTRKYAVCVCKCLHVQLFPNLVPAAPPRSCFFMCYWSRVTLSNRREGWASAPFPPPLRCSFHCRGQPSLPQAEVDADGRVERQKESHFMMMCLSC